MNRINGSIGSKTAGGRHSGRAMRIAVACGVLCCGGWIFGPAVSDAATTWYVATNGSDEVGVSGQSWATAFLTISNAVSKAQPGDLVLLSNGVHTLTEILQIRKLNLTLRGAYGRDATTITGLGGLDFRTDGVLDGVTIANLPTYAVRARMDDGSATTEHGVTIVNCALVSNETTFAGAGVYCYGNDDWVTITNCLIAYNKTTSTGGGAHLKNAKSLMKDCTIMHNTAIYGGGVRLDLAMASGCLIVSNTSTTAGGGVQVNSGKLRNCLVVGNTNEAATGGGGVHMGGSSSPLIQNCTIVANGAQSGGLVMTAGTMINSIVYFNKGGASSNVSISGSGIISNSCVGMADPGEGNINLDPKFADGAYRLSGGSPCLNAGWYQADWMADATDLDGFPRVRGTSVDMGCYETPFGETKYVSLDGGHVWPFTNWADAATDVASALLVAGDGGTVLVTNGIYPVNAELRLDGEVTVQSVNGPEETTLDANYSGRCVNVYTNATLDGFTLAHATYNIVYGGRIINCHVVSNTSYGVQFHLTAEGGLVSNCFIAYNENSGVFAQKPGNVVADSTFMYNTGTHGAGVRLNPGAMASGCLIVSNTSSAAGGGAYVNGGTLRNCLVAGNTNTFISGGGGGVSSVRADSLIQNCTIVANSAEYGGLTMSAGTSINSIVYFNQGPSSSNVYITAGSISNSCVGMADAGAWGEGNISEPPQFVSEQDFRLADGSPCINNGLNQDWMNAAVDLGRNRRLDKLSRRVDMGAYEYVFQASMIQVR